MTAYSQAKILRTMTQEKADAINSALVGILDIANGRADPSTYTLHESTLVRYPDLRMWFEATDLIDNWNKREARVAQLADREPRFVRTCDDKFMAAMFAFLSFPPEYPIVWNGSTYALVIIPAKKEEKKDAL